MAGENASQNQTIAINPWLIAASVMLPTFMEVLDTSIASVALPHIAGSLSATTDEATWVLTSYLVANAIVLPASGWFSLRFGRRNFLVTCIVIFTAASFACGAATSLGFILVARAIQGAAGGALQPLSQASLLESFPLEKRGAAMAIFALGVVVAPVLGPTLGGWLTDQYTWRWAFYINIPIGIAAVLMISKFVVDPPYIQNARRTRFDGIGLGLLAVWLGSLQVILDKGQEDDWFGAIWMRWAVAILVAGFIAFLIRELLTRQPIVDLRVFRNRNFALGCLLIGIFGAVIYGIVTILPLFYQTLLGYTAMNSGLAVSPRGVGAILVMPVIGVLTSRLDTRWMISFGFGLFALTAIQMANLTLQISQWSLTWPIVLSGVASGLVFVPLSTTAMGTLSNEQIGNASGLYNLLRNVGGSIGISLVNTIIARHSQAHRSDLAHDISHGPALQRALNVYHGLMSADVASSTATHRAYLMIQNIVDQQSTLYSYVDDLQYMAMACLCCIPIVFMLQKVKARQGAAAAGH
ncbi:MAG: DHA2 family efflux MFS transporter permease subunit [Candidatus Acidiferrum sp.]